MPEVAGSSLALSTNLCYSYTKDESIFLKGRQNQNVCKPLSH